MCPEGWEPDWFSLNCAIPSKTARVVQYFSVIFLVLGLLFIERRVKKRSLLQMTNTQRAMHLTNVSYVSAQLALLCLAVHNGPVLGPFAINVALVWMQDLSAGCYVAFISYDLVRKGVQTAYALHPKLQMYLRTVRNLRLLHILSFKVVRCSSQRRRAKFHG